MGHRQVTTTVRHYLDMALLKEFGVAKRERLSTVQSVWNAFMQGRDALTPRRVGLLKELIQHFVEAAGECELEEILDLALRDDTLIARGAQISSRRPNLTLVK